MEVDVSGEFRTTLLNMKEKLRQGSNDGSRVGRSRTTEELDAALQRLDDGTFGICESCFLVMPRSDLLLQPERRNCVRCSERPRVTSIGSRGPRSTGATRNGRPSRLKAA